MRTTIDKNVRLAIIGIAAVVAIIIAIIIVKKQENDYGCDKR